MNRVKQTSFFILIPILGVILGVSIAVQFSAAGAQTTSQTEVLLEDFQNDRFPPVLSTSFNHTFSLATAWDLGGSTIGEPLSQTPPFALTLYAGNEDRVTFNLLTGFSYVTSAQVRGWAPRAEFGSPGGRGQVVFEGTGDVKTFKFEGGAVRWQLFQADQQDLGDGGYPLGPIVAVRLTDIGNNGTPVMFDDLEVVSETPPRRSDLALTMTPSASVLTVGQIVTYDLTVTNLGPQDAPGVTLENILPYGGSFVSNNPNCLLSAGRVRCDLGTLGVGASHSLSLGIEVQSNTCATFTNRAFVSAQAVDTNVANNSASSSGTTPLPACADFEVAINASPVPIDSGSDLTYVVTIHNLGPDPASGTVTFTLPMDYTTLALTPDSGMTCGGISSPHTCTLPNLLPGEQTEVLVRTSASPSTSGLQTASAHAAPSLPDPALTNNASRFRFVMGRPFDFNIIAELDSGDLDGFDTLWSIDINNSGEVAFYILDYNQPDYSFRIYTGDGVSVTQKFTDADLPSLSGGLLHRPNFSCVDINDDGALTFISDIADPAINSNLSSATRVGSLLHHISADGTFTTIDSQTLAADGPAFRVYNQAVFDQLGRVMVAYSTKNRSAAEGILRFENGQSFPFYTAAETGIEIERLGSSPKSFGWLEKEGWLFPTYRLLSVRETGSGLYVSDQLQQPGQPLTNGMIGITDLGVIPYAQKETDPQTGTTIESFYLFNGREPLMRGITFDSFDPFSFRDVVINEDARFVVRSRSIASSYYGSLGLFLGPDPIGHRVVRTNSGKGDALFGSKITYLLGQGGTCSTALNDRGQIAFAVGLEDGRILVVRSEPTSDNDGDGISDWEELGAPNLGDGNADGIVDWVQPHIASVSHRETGHTLTFAADPNSTLTNASAVPNPSPGNAPTVPFPFGHFAFELSDIDPGGQASVTITLPWGAVRSWWKYGPTPGNPAPHWYEFTYDGSTGAEIDGNVVTLHFVDGERGDGDLSANGVIVDPGGPSGYPHAIFTPLVMR